MMDMGDDVVIFTEALDDLVVSWVVKVGSTVAVADAFVVAVTGVSVVYVSPLDALLIFEAIADVVATASK